MPRLQPNSGNFEPLPLDEILVAKITDIKDQPPPKDHPNWNEALNVEFTIIEGDYTDRKAWRNFPLSWPTEDKKGSTLLFDLVAAFDGKNAVKGSEYDTDNLRAKVGRIQMENKVNSKTKEPIVDANGNQRQQPKAFFPLKGEQATTTTATTKATVGVAGKVGF